jgi:hypothetical protein
MFYLLDRNKVCRFRNSSTLVASRLVLVIGPGGNSQYDFRCLVRAGIIERMSHLLLARRLSYFLTFLQLDHCLVSEESLLSTQTLPSKDLSSLEGTISDPGHPIEFLTLVVPPSLHLIV